MARASEWLAGWTSRFRPGRAQAIARPDSLIVLGSGLFDYGFYLRHQPDVEAAGADALDHFLTYGWREGRRPNPYFDVPWYHDHYCAIGPTATNPLVHYIEGGEAEGCRPIAFFDPTWYRATYYVPKRDLALAHYLAHRRTQKVSPNADFDVAAYVARHARAIGPKGDPFEHFLKNDGGSYRETGPRPDLA